MPAMLLLAHIAFFGSCEKKESALGLEVQPQDEELGVLYVDTFTIITQTIKEDLIVSDPELLLRYDYGDYHFLLGEMTDSVFGTSKASFYTQVRLPKDNPEIGDPSKIAFDSLVLMLGYNNFYGRLSPQNYSVYEVTEDIIPSEQFNSFAVFNTNAVPIGKLGYHTPAPFDSLIIAGKKTAPHLRIKLSWELGQRLAEKIAQGSITDNEFVEYFKGIHVVAEDNSRYTGEGAILTFNPLSDLSAIRLYYKDSSSSKTLKTFDFVINTGSKFANSYTHDYSNTPVEEQLQNPNLGKQEVYLHSMGGLKAKVQIPNLKELGKAKNLAINKAELIVPYEPRSLKPHDKIYLYKLDALGNPSKIIDFTLQGAYQAVSYDAAKREYRFNISRYVNQVINENLTDYGLLIIPGASAVDARGAILKGGHPYNSMRLKITYTEL